LQTSFLKNVLTLVSGNVIALALPIFFYPILSRIFTPADYALFGLYVSVFSFLEIGSAGRYDFAVMMPKRDDAAINLVAGGFVFSLVYALFVLILVMALGGWISTSLNNPDLSKWLFFLPAALIFISISKLGNSWLIRQKQFKASSFNKASQKIAETSSQMMLGYFKIGNGLIFGDVIGRFFNAIFSIYQCAKGGFDQSNISSSKIKHELKQYIGFPKFNVFPSMLNALSGMLPVFIISSHFSVDVAGSYNFSRIILSVPFALISAGISQVLMQQTSERRHRNEPVAPDLLSLATKLAALSVLGIIILYLWGPLLFEIFFGTKWKYSGQYTSILIFSYGISFIVSPFSVLLAVFDKIKHSGFWQTFYFVCTCSLWFFSDFSIERFLEILVIIDVICYAVYGIIIYNAVKHYEHSRLTSI
jgi:O-antigen/teichoic acid export membrane protein